MGVESYHRIRAGVDSGKIRCGSDLHLEILDIDQRLRGLPPRQKALIQMGLSGFAHLAIAEHFGISRSRVTHNINEFLRVEELTRDNLTALARAALDPNA